MTRDEELLYGLAILAAAAEGIVEKQRELIREGRDLRHWCVAVGPSKGFPGASEVPGETQFAVVTMPRERIAARFVEVGRRDIAAGIRAWVCDPGTCLVVVTCKELTQLHRRAMPPRGQA